jgi:transposase-like protein
MGRPDEFTDEKADEICARIAEGESVRTICRDENMPATETFYRWLRKHESFRERYARAKEDQADALAEEILDISDDGTNDWMEKRNQEGEVTGWQVNGEAVQRSKLRVDSRKWLAGKLKPKKYGDKIQQEISGDLSITDRILEARKRSDERD